MIDSIIKRVDQITNLQNKNSIKLYLIALQYNLNIKDINLDARDISIVNKLGIVKRHKRGVTLDVTTKSVNEIIESRWKEYRNLFSKEGKGKRGLRPKCLSTESEIKIKLKRFLTSNPGISFEEILNATKWYIKPFKDKGNFTYMRGAGFFIYKDVIEAGFTVTKSDLEVALGEYENVDEEEWFDQI